MNNLCPTNNIFIFFQMCILYLSYVFLNSGPEIWVSVQRSMLSKSFVNVWEQYHHSLPTLSVSSCFSYLNKCCYHSSYNHSSQKLGCPFWTFPLSYWHSQWISNSCHLVLIISNVIHSLWQSHHHFLSMSIE